MTAIQLYIEYQRTTIIMTQRKPTRLPILLVAVADAVGLKKTPISQSYVADAPTKEKSPLPYSSEKKYELQEHRMRRTQFGRNRIPKKFKTSLSS
jgi:hypothetical protein